MALQLMIVRRVSMGGNLVSGNDNRSGHPSILKCFRFVKVQSSGVNSFKLVDEITNSTSEDKPCHPNSTPSQPRNTNRFATQLIGSEAISPGQSLISTLTQDGMCLGKPPISFGQLMTRSS
ncbi:hypothetical protein LOK49_LG05G02721 [Camellia lanceoleosa]|uniref:Uncharacterized protein n=2 Tax=Camellia lanceoleosa TaxID=1840588 RepID=A0ACC0HRD5_9ERIC|nr:hypothetical protein LOK49_LG05G02712 [Camellia lanceoleosa]KAI8016724.1 hypothetical protein LOK49_LG05G02721 [Camellia lanceoleosa]